MRQALILAAGRGRRMGVPKALVALAGRPLLQRVLDSLGGFDRIVCIVGAEEPAIRAAIEPAAESPAPLLVRNPDPDRGRTTSIQIGLAELAPGQSILLWPVDIPCARPRTLEQLYRGSIAELDWRIPIHAGRRGHPVLLGPGLAGRIAGLGPDEPLRNLQRSTGVAIREVAVEDRGILLDLNTPADLREAAAWLEGADQRPR